MSVPLTEKQLNNAVRKGIKHAQYISARDNIYANNPGVPLREAGQIAKQTVPGLKKQPNPYNIFVSRFAHENRLNSAQAAHIIKRDHLYQAKPKKTASHGMVQLPPLTGGYQNIAKKYRKARK